MTIDSTTLLDSSGYNRLDRHDEASSDTMVDIFNAPIHRLTALYCCCLILGAVSNVAAEENTTVQDEAIDEVVVVGDKSLVTLRRAVFRAEEDFYSTFNEHNSDDEFDIHCRYDARSGTRIRRHSCIANFLRTAATRRAMRWAGTGSRSDGVETPYARVEKKLKQLEEEMESLVKSEPKLLAAALEVERAKTTYKVERERRCKDKVLACN